jgi:hypothetical protein
MARFRVSNRSREREIFEASSQASLSSAGTGGVMATIVAGTNETSAAGLMHLQGE